MKVKLIAITLIALSFLSFTNSVIADEHQGQIAVVWKIVAKSGSGPAMMDAIAKHMKWRADNNDPWAWTAFEDTTGDPVNVIYFRSGNHHWSDIDAYEGGDFDEKAGDHWNANVGPHVKYYNRSFSKTDPVLANWPEGDYSHFRVITFTLKGGHERAFRATLEKAHAALMKGDWDSVHGWSWPLDGTLNEATVVIARGNWAGFEAGERGGPWDHIAKAVGEDEAEALRKDFSSHIKHTSAEYYAEIPELSIDAAK